MGCASARSGKAADMISNREVQPEEEVPVHHHGIGSMACGYGFSLNNQQLNQLMAVHLKSKRRESEMQKFQKFQEKYLKIKESYKEHDIDTCFSLASECERMLRDIDFTIVEMAAGQREDIKAFLEKIEEEYEEMKTFLKFYDEGWEDQGEKDGVHMYTRREEGTIGALMEKNIQLPVEIFLTILSEMDFYTELIKDVKESRQQKYIGRNHKIGYCLYDVPIISLRQAFFEGLGYNRLNHNDTIFMYSRSVNNNPELCKRLEYEPKLHEKYVQIQYKYMMVKYIPEGIHKGRVSIAVNIDMKISFVPLWIMEMVVKKFCLDFFGVVMSAAKSFKGSKWDEKVKKHPESFQFFRDIIGDYYIKKGYK